MTSPERLKELQGYYEEYYADSPLCSDERKTEIVSLMVSYANEEMPESKCVICGNTAAYIPDTRPYGPGHVYSHDGMREYQSITKICEWCFDRLSLEPDDPRRTEWFGEKL